jgi:hypothetical protein
MQKQKDLLGAIINNCDLSLAPEHIADAAIEAYDGCVADPSNNTYVDVNPIGKLLNWDKQITVKTSHARAAYIMPA